MEKQVPLTYVFERGCEHLECIYNDEYYCDHNNILEHMMYDEGDNFATCCAFKVKEGFCSECGYRLIKTIDWYPYGEHNVPYESLQCPNCD